MTFIKGKNNPRYKHGGKGTKLFSVWRGMKRRCNEPSNISYKYYGGKGVIVCDDWYSFINFRDWANKNGYSDTLTLDRIDSNGNYDPQNCRWVDWITQTNNRSSNRCFIIDGIRYTLTELSRKHNIPSSTLINRLDRFDNDIIKSINYINPRQYAK